LAGKTTMFGWLFSNGVWLRKLMVLVYGAKGEGLRGFMLFDLGFELCYFLFAVPRPLLFSLSFQFPSFGLDFLPEEK